MDKIDMRSFVLIRKQKICSPSRVSERDKPSVKTTHQYEYTEDCPLFQVFSYIISKGGQSMYEDIRRKIFVLCEGMGIVLADDVAVVFDELVRVGAISAEVAAAIEDELEGG